MSAELGRRAVACKAWRWMPGMLLLHSSPTHRLTFVSRGEPYQRDDEPNPYPVMESGGPDNSPAWGWPSRDSGWLPDISDPATLGCLLALVREVWGVPTLTTSFVDHMDQVAWSVDDMKGRPLGYGATEAEALVAALEAAP